MQIGILGAGNIGATLTRRLTALGHQVVVANSTRAGDALRAGGRDLASLQLAPARWRTAPTS